MKVKKGFNHMKDNGFAVSDILHTLAGPSLDSLDLVKLVQCAPPLLIKRNEKKSTHVKKCVKIFLEQTCSVPGNKWLLPKMVPN